MKHIKLFNTDAQYQEFASDAAQPIPNVSYVTETDEVHYNESDPILFAYQYQADKFVMGVVIGSDIYVDTYETGFIVADGSGKFSTALAYTNDDLINIQNAIKDHYHLAASTIKTKAPLIEYAVGDPVPNWNAYEKIEMQSQKIAAKLGSGEQGTSLILGTLTNKNFELVTNGSQSYVVDSSGIVLPILGPPASSTEYIIGILQSVGITATSISEEIVSWEVGSAVPNWNEYTQYT